MKWFFNFSTRAELSQKQASQYARSLIEASLDPLVTISPDGKITDVNEGSIKVTGVRREELIGTGLFQLLHRAGAGPRGLPGGVRQGLRHRLSAHDPAPRRQAHRRAVQRLGLQGRSRKSSRGLCRGARRDGAEAGLAVRPQSDRGESGSAGHHQRGRQDHRRERGQHQGDRRPATS